MPKPESGKRSSEKKEGSHTRNTADKISKTKEDNYINLSQNLVFNDRDYLNQCQKPLISARGGADSYRDRSYFDESPAIFDQHQDSN